MINIRAGHAHDAAAVRHVHVTAFPTQAEANLVEQLRGKDKQTVSLVAETQGVIVGHVLFTRVAFDPPLPLTAFALGPMAVLRGYENLAVGRRLVQNGLVECHNRDACMVVVLGDHGYYSRFGFERASRYGLRSEFGTEASFMVFMLEAPAHPPPSTLVKYAAEFRTLPRDSWV